MKTTSDLDPMMDPAQEFGSLEDTLLFLRKNGFDALHRPGKEPSIVLVTKDSSEAQRAWDLLEKAGMKVSLPIGKDLDNKEEHGIVEADEDEAFYDSLNPGIRNFVRFLRRNGFDTIDSGDGNTHEFDCDRDFPFVSIQCRPETMVMEAQRLYDLLADEGIRVESVGPTGYEPCIQASFDPALDIGIIDIMNISDKNLPKTS